LLGDTEVHIRKVSNGYIIDLCKPVCATEVCTSFEELIKTLARCFNEQIPKTRR